MKTQLRMLVGLVATSMIFVACGTAEDDKKQTVDPPKKELCGAKCDTPNQAKDYDPLKACEAHANFTKNSTRPLFTRDAIRWACADVEGVSADDLGQEYCEYFAVVQFPDVDNDELSNAVAEVGRLIGQTDRGMEVSPFGVSLNDDQLDWLDDNSEEVVGQCVFTSWHQDMDSLPCEKEDNCPAIVADWKVSKDHMRMKVPFNSNSAARALVREALESIGQGAVNDFGDHYVNGCMVANSLYGTEWRRSDHEVAVVAYQLATCGCSVGDAKTAAEAADLIVPSADFQRENNEGELSLRGFRLGTWSDSKGLPADCEYVQTENSLQTMVKCSVYGSDLADNSDDLKGFCRKKYAKNIVVHVPLAADAISCEIPEDATHCPTPEPWVLGSKEEDGE